MIARPRPIWLVVGLLATANSIVPQARADVAHLILNSQAGDYIGQGKSFDITYNTADTPAATVSAQIRKTVAGGAPGELLFVIDRNIAATNTFGLLFFGTDQLGIPIAPGTYGLPGNTAQRVDFAQPGHAGLDVSFQNRGSNTLTGNFTINSVSFFHDASNALEVGSFSATFEQHSEGNAPALFGSFTFQSSNSLALVPEPSPLLLAPLAGAFGLVLRRVRRCSEAA